MAGALVFLGAGLLDEALGDPEGWPHPVRVFGWLITRLDSARLGCSRPWLLRLLGLGLALGLPALAACFAWGIVRACGPWGWVPTLLLGAWMLAGRSLRVAVRLVQLDLETGRLVEARFHIGRVVGRDTEALDEAGIVRAAVETLAESLCDGVVAPLFWFALLGLPGLWAFKVVSTLDSMVGHRETPWTHFGWASARLDDLANWVPARITALLIALGAPSSRALRVAWRDAGRTASPNAGWPEAAMAGALGVQLGGLNWYDGVPHLGPQLGDGGAVLDGEMLERALSLTLRVNLLALLTGTLILGAVHG